MSTIMASLCCSRHNKIYNGMFIVKKHCQESNLNKYTSKCWGTDHYFYRLHVDGGNLEYRIPSPFCF